MILYKHYLEAKKLIEAYEDQLNEALVSSNNLHINQKVKRNYPESWDYWISEIKGEDVLIRTTEDENDPKYDDFLVNVAELRLV